MPCLHGDQPLRVKLSKNGVVHAASMKSYGGFYRYSPGGPKGGTLVPKEDKVYMACRRHPLTSIEKGKYLVGNDNEITCKQCMKLIGFVEEPICSERYVVFNDSTKEFYKNTTSRCSAWSTSINDAFIFKSKASALKSCRVYKYDAEGKIMNYKEWADAGKPKAKYVQVKLDHLNVKTVKITLI